jgi:hypothetical protein
VPLFAWKKEQLLLLTDNPDITLLSIVMMQRVCDMRIATFDPEEYEKDPSRIRFLRLKKSFTSSLTPNTVDEICL